MSPVRIAVVGVGALGRHHARILSGLDRAELVAVADPSQTQGQAVAESCGCRWVPDYRELLGEIDAVSIAAPTRWHQKIACDCLDQRIPVLVEKPLAASLLEAECIHATAQRNGILLQVGHIERFNPATATAFAVCGRPKYIRAERVSPYSFRSTDIGVVHDLMIHDLDLILDLVGSAPVDVQAFGMCVMGGHEDMVQARITFENGCIADVTASRLNPTAHRTMQVWSPESCVNIDFHERTITSFAPTETLLYGTPPTERAMQPGADIACLKADVFERFIQVKQLPVSSADALTLELESFLDCIQTGEPPIVGGVEAVRAMRVADAVLKSVADHQWDGTAAGPIGPHAQFASMRQLRVAG